MRTRPMIVSLMSGVSAVVGAPIARADDHVLYEVTSDYVAVADIEYFDRSERRLLNAAPLPWRTDVAVVDAHSPSTSGAEVRADWRPVRAPNKWVTVRISFRGKVICQNTLDVGDAACYGSTSFMS